ncbi:uncharacterized protein LOC115441659 [Manduca sexta]|uniref:uncharacterized protein LOC115441659 n=1 Tax=Manduca sexta TaxID=7130 RepID=UPI00118200E3|nr:uncharacterized protein LOC115441659 [Manduca sexta]
MAGSHLIICLFLSFLSRVYSSDVLCEKGFCSEFIHKHGCSPPVPHCSYNNATHNGLWLPSPTICNCCPFCLEFLREDEHCSLGGPGAGTTVGRCGDGLTCVADPIDGYSYCKKMSSKCHTAQTNFDTRRTRGEMGSLEFRPHCDAKGKYAPFDCVLTQTCFCQSEEGERLFGEVVYRGTLTTQSMHCGCSRLHQRIMKRIQPGLAFPVFAPRCTSDGNFFPVQCIGRKCYCVDRVTGHIVNANRPGYTLDLRKYPITDLACYDPALDNFPHLNEGSPPYNFTAPCFEEQRLKVEMIQQSKEDGFNVDFFNSFGECMPDGTYGHVVMKRDRSKICADETGRQIAKYSAAPNTPEYESMNCKCAYTSHVMGSTSERPVCCKNGNFRRIQCRRGFCRCVDEDGRQQGREAADVTSLSCFTTNWRTC